MSATVEPGAEPLRVQQRDSTLTITLNRPAKRNAIDRAITRGLRDALDLAARAEDIKVVVLTGAGGVFSSGYDLSETPDSPLETAEAWHRSLGEDVELTMRLWSLPRPTIAAVSGWCLGGGCELAMACDMVLADDTARFGAPEILYGGSPAALLMPFILGQKKTSELLFTGADIDAHEAERLGLINRVVPGADLEDTVAEFVRRIGPTPLKVLRLTKLALVRSYEAMGIRQAVAANLDLSGMVNVVDTPEQRRFEELVEREGLRSALRWRDQRYGT